MALCKFYEEVVKNSVILWSGYQSEGKGINEGLMQYKSSVFCLLR